jgi:hypothetical protein
VSLGSLGCLGYVKLKTQALKGGRLPGMKRTAFHVAAGTDCDRICVLASDAELKYPFPEVTSDLYRDKLL